MKSVRLGALEVAPPAALLVTVGLLLIVVGVGLIYLPLGIIVAGIETAAVGVAVDLSTPDEEPAR